MAKTARDDELSSRPAIKRHLQKVFDDVEKGFQDQRDRSDALVDYWQAYNCILGHRQFYAGNSKLYVPIVRSAIEARKTRFINQLFPVTGRYVDVTTGDEDIPNAWIAVLENYVSRARLRDEVLPALLVNGDVEGQYTVYVDWDSTTRHCVSREWKGVEIDGLEHTELGEIETVSEEEIDDARPSVEVISDNDFLVLPASADSLEQALQSGGSITVIRRWSKETIKQKIKDAVIASEPGKQLTAEMSKRETLARRDTAKQLGAAAGIKVREGQKFALVYETWTMLKVDGERRICRSFYGGESLVLGAKLNPYWCDKVPMISAPRVKVHGVFKGMSAISPGVLDMQIAANDAINEGADNLHFRLNPITTIDPEQVGRWEGLYVMPGALWPVKPSDVKFQEFPAVMGEAWAAVSAYEQKIFQALSITPAMMPQTTGGKNKRNQAELAAEQQVDLLSTADSVTIVEHGIMTPVVQRFAEYDVQFRDEDILVRSYGQLGLSAVMEEIEPMQMDRRYEFRWFGVEASRDASRIQQQIAMINVFKGIPQEMYPEYQFNIAPFMEAMAANAFGPRMSRLVFTKKDRQGIDPEVENGLMEAEFDVLVHPTDDDQKHMQVHMQALQAGDHKGIVQRHMMHHQQQAMAKMQAQMQEQAQKGAPGGPGGAGPGVAGTPKPGAQPTAPRQMKGPEGMIRPDNMARAGAITAPRKT